jgi:hypothetical protein
MLRIDHCTDYDPEHGKRHGDHLCTCTYRQGHGQVHVCRCGRHWGHPVYALKKTPTARV